MFKIKDNSIARKISFILVFITFSFITILIAPENSDIQILLFFLIGCMMGYSHGQFYTKVDVILHYFIIILFFVFHFFFIPNKTQSILFLLGALVTINFKKDFNNYK